MNIYLLDTSTIIDYIRDKGETVELVNSLKGKLTTSYFCLAKLYEGVFTTKSKKAANAINIFMSGINKIFAINMQIALKFGEIRTELRKKGKIIEDIDIFIAATCLVFNLTLVTQNKKHFGNVDSLKIYVLSK